MRTGLQFPPGADSTTLLTGRSSADHVIAECGNPMLDDVDYDNIEAVERAREAILRMGVWNAVAWVFEPGGEHEALEAIADAFLCQQAAIWQRNHPDRLLVAGLSERHLHAAQVRVLSLLSSRGAQTMTADYVLMPDGIRYLPKTGYGEADEMLTMVVSEPVMHAVLEGTAGSCHAAAHLAEHAHARAMYWERVGGRELATGNFEAAALSQEAAARVWQGAGRPTQAGVIYDKAAENWWRLDRYDEGARASEKSAVAWAVAGEPGQAGRAYLEAAMGWHFGRKSAMAAQAFEMAAEVFHDACGSESDQAINAWTMAAAIWNRAGAPDQAVRVWTNALKKDDPDTAVARKASTEASSLFRVALEYENALS